MVGNNHFSGTIPAEFGSLQNLTLLHFPNNDLTGIIPVEFGHLLDLEDLNLSQNQLTGNIPVTLGDLSNLEYLNLSSNDFRNGIPSELGNLSNLIELSIASNYDLAGSIPSAFGNLKKLERLTLNVSSIGGQLPSEMGEMTNLQELVLGPNQISGPIPSEIGNLANLRVLALFELNLTGSIPPALGDLSSLERLALQGNILTGTIPVELGNLTNLKNLYLYENALSGEIPTTILNLVNLEDDNWYWYWGFDEPAGLGYNKLTSSDPTVIAFLNAKAPGWVDTQTIPPTDFQISNIDGNEVGLSWTPITYTRQGGYYEIFTAINSGGPFSKHGDTITKTASTYSATKLIPDTTYYLKVRTHTPVHGLQQNDLWSEFTGVVSATTELVGAQTEVDISTGDVIVYTDTQGITITIEIPASSVTETTTIVYTEAETSTEKAPSGFLFAGRTFNINAYQDGAIVDEFSFATAITLTLHYIEAEISTPEDKVMLKYWDEDQSEWQDAACGAYERHLAEDWLSVPICHLSDFALFGKNYAVYLPLVIRYLKTRIREASFYKFNLSESCA
jgi:Leucine-rich repeat (LRR) protein